MLIVHRTSWFKGLAAFTATTTLWLTIAGTAEAASRRTGVGADEVARRLGVDLSAIAGTGSAESDRVAERRTKALDRLRQRTAADPAAVARADAVKMSTRRAHLSSLLGGVALATEEARRAAAAPTRDEEAARRLAHASRSIERGLQRAEQVSNLEGRLANAAANARKLAGAAGRAGRPGGDAAAAEVRRLAPKPAAPLDTRSRLPMMLQHVAPPAPRSGARLGVAPSPEQRDLYVSLLDAPGLQVETELGPVEPAVVAAGLAPTLAIAFSGGAGDLGGLLELAAGALPGPVEADLTLDREVQVTPEIQAKVEALGRDPISIFNFVHDAFDAEPYYGAKKGSAGAWEARAGNDADLSILLVAMLRAAGIPSRFEYGTVDLTPEQAMAWTGTTEVYQAGDALATGGIPTTVIERPAERVVRVEHVWVRAWVPYSNYRGLPRAGSRATWVRLDPALQRATVRPATNLRGKVSFDYSAFLAQVGGQTPLQVYEGQLRAYAQVNGIPCKTLDDFIPARERVADGLTLLPAELPARIQSVIATFAGFPGSLRHGASIGIGGVTASLPLTESFGAAVTLRYRGATAADDAAISAAGGIANVAQPSSIRVVPTVTLDGVERLRGPAVIPGTQQELTVQIASPNDGTSIVRHQVRAGSVFAIALLAGKVPDSVVEKHEVAYSRAALGGVTGDDLEAARGNRAAWRYFWHLTRDWDRLFALEWSRVGFGVSAGIAGRTVAAQSLYDVPVSIRPGDFVIDVPRLEARPYSVDGSERARLSSVFELAGYDGSTWEHLIWEETVHVPAVSTVRVLQASRQQGLQLRTLTAADAGTIPLLPYSDSAKEDIADALHRGLVVTLPERPITWATYPNAEGYVLKDPRTGAADFRLNGLYSGGDASGTGAPNPIACPNCSSSNRLAASSVRMSDGAMYFSETDLVVPARGLPVAFSRRYNSASPHGGRLGPGWQHTYEVKLLAEPDGAVTWVNDELYAVRFTRAQGGTFEPPAGFHERLEEVGGGWRLTFKDGLQYRFAADGQLAAIQDPNDHLVLLRYDSGRLASVTDASARTVLTFGYDGAGLLASVRDPAGREVQFGHTGGDLTSVTDVTRHAQGYGYDSAHRMTSKTDRNGNTTLEFYDAEGRWVGSSDPAGFGRAVSYDMLNRRAVHEDKTGATTLFEYNEAGNPVVVTDALGNRHEMRWEANQKTWEKDARGNETFYTYDAQGNLETRTDALGVVTRYTYDGGGRVLTVTTAGKLVAQNTYDARGNLETAVDAAGKTTTYAYTADGLPQTITQPGGAATSLEYNADGTVKSITDGEHGTTSLAYDTFGHLQSIKDPLQHERTLAADAAGRIQSMTDALQKTTTFEYDNEGNRKSVIDPDQHRTEFKYDALGRLAAVTDAIGSVTRTTYDPEGRVLSRTDPLGRTTTHRYDVTGRLVETKDGAGGTTTLGYCADVSGQACAVVDALGHYAEISFDPLGRPGTTVDANGTQTVEHYDAFGRRDSTRVAGTETTYEYDGAGRLWKVRDALGGVTEYGYDGRGNRTSVKDANGATTAFGYDLANRLVWERNPLQAIGQETKYEYDAAGNRRFKTDGNGVRTEYVYDANRRLRTVLFPDGTHHDYDYDARGNRTLEKSASHERGLEYDEVGRLVRVEDRALGRVIRYAYDPAGQRRRMWLDTGESVSYQWDGAGRLLETRDPQSHATLFSYDAAGRRTGATYGNGTRASYAYDAAGQVLSIAYLDRSGAVQTAFGYGYDAHGNRTYKQFADGAKEEYGYDALNRLTSARYPGGRDVLYAYDAVGNRVSMHDSARAPVTRWATAATATSTYGGCSAAKATGAPDQTSCSLDCSTSWVAGADTSPIGRPEFLELTYAQAERAIGVTVHETYGNRIVSKLELLEEDGTAHTVWEGIDQTTCGNWLTVRFPMTSYAAKKVRVWTQAPDREGIDTVGLEVMGGDSYAYNGFNQLTTVAPRDGTTATTFGYDGNGNQTSKTDASGTTTYVYNQDNRLVGIALAAGGSNAFEYDANGLRTKKTDSAGTTRYLLDGLSVIAQYAPDGQRQAWYTQSLARIDEVLNVANDSGKLWYQADALGSVYGLTNQAGALIGSQNYDVFGAPTPAPSGPAGQPFGFTGREHELDSGLVYARARYLDPAVGRWDRPDPLGFVDGPNHYGYVRGNPTRYSDPTGFAARTTVEAYAMRWPFAFVMLLMDLGAISELALFVGSAGAVAIPISHIISAEWSRERARDRTDACPIPAPPPVERTYYRGLSWDDLREFELFGVVLSKFARAGGDFIEALEYFITGVRTHSWNSDDIGGGIPSPFVSTSTNEATARGFAERESKVVISLRTERAGIPIDNRFFGEDEVLFFLMLGMPGEQMEIVP